MISDYKQEYERWLDNVSEPELSEELLDMDPAAAEDAFYRDLEFGTGGLRGVIGAGTNRMNVYVVAKASQGLADYLNKTAGARPLVVIGYDTRIKSDVFSRVAASVFAANGINVTALDVSDTALKDVNHPKITPVCADLRDYEPKEASFEAVYANLSLHYFDDAMTRRIFKKMEKALTDGGAFFVRCRSVNDPLYGRGRKIAPDMFENPYVRHFFSVDYMRSLLDGFDTVAVREVAEDYYGESVFTEAIAVKGFS